MATNTTTTLSDQYQNYFSKKLLTYAVQALVLDQFGMKTPLPAKSGHKTISMFRFNTPSASSIENLTEGTTTSGTRSLTLTKIDKDLLQRGQVIKLTDVLNATDLFNSLQQSIKISGQDSALDMDNITRNILIGSNVLTTTAQSGGGAMEGGYSDPPSTNLDNGDTLTEMYADGTRQTTAETQYNAFDDSAGSGAGADNDNCLRGAAILDAVTQLKVNRAQPLSGGMYVAVTSPQVISDVMQQSAWLNAAQYSNVEELYKGELGRLYGAKFVMTTNGWISGDAGGATDAERFVYDDAAGGGVGANKDIHATLFLGDQAYGIPELASQSPFSPKVIITDSADKTDPLNQLTTAGFKTFWSALRLNTGYYVIMRSKTNSTA